MIPIVFGLIVKAATVVRAVQAISSALRPSPKPPVSESVPRSEKVLCGRFAHSRDKYRYCGNDPIGCQDSLGLKKAKLRTLEFDVRSPIKTCFLKITVDVYYDDDTGIVSFENGQVSGKLPVQGNLAIGIDTSFRTKTQEWEGGDQESTVSSFDKNKPFSHNLEGIYPVRGPGANGGQVDIKVDFKMNLTYISPKGVSTKSDSNTTGWFGIGLGTDFQPVPVAPHFGRDGSGGIPGITR